MHINWTLMNLKQPPSRFLMKTGRCTRIPRNSWKWWKLLPTQSWRSWTDSKRSPIANPSFWKMSNQDSWTFKEKKKKDPEDFFHIIFFLFEKIFLSQRKFQFYDSTILWYARKKKKFFFCIFETFLVYHSCKGFL